MSVYFARVGRYIKVGYSANPERRVANLFKSATRYSAPRDIDAATPRTLLGYVPGRLNEERTAHAALRDFRVQGEWFLDEPWARTYVDGCIATGAVHACYMSRPDGEYFRDEDPVLMPSPEEREAGRLIAANIFAGTSRAHSP